MRIIENVRPTRQTVMFSATFPKQVEMLAKRILHMPLEIVVGSRSVVADTVTQAIEVRPEETKFRRLLELVKARSYLVLSDCYVVSVLSPLRAFDTIRYLYAVDANVLVITGVVLSW